MLRVRMFGPLRLEVGGRPVPEIAGLKPRSVLAWLLLHPGPHARTRVAAQFWPDVLETSSRASLRSALWTIRGALEAADASEWLSADRDAVGFSSACDIDAANFDALCAAGTPADLERALDLASVPLLTDLADDWVLEARDAYAERASAAALRLAEDADAAGDLARAVSWTRRALAHARLNEATHRLLIRRLAAAGERAEALAAFGRLEHLLAAEFGTRPGPETLAQVASIRAGGSTRVQRARPEKGRRAGSTPPFVARGAELGALGAAWDDARKGAGGVALVTGAAGLGKSRLAMELARRAEDGGGMAVTGAALELSGAAPFGAWIEALTQLVARSPAPPEEVAWPHELARLCSAVEVHWKRAPAASGADPSLERARLFESVQRAIDWGAGQQPLLIVLEDLHLADAAGLALLAHVARGLARGRVLVLATRRPGRHEHVDAAISALSRHQPLVADLHLRPLTDTDAAVIVAATEPALRREVRARVVAMSDGNPLLAVQGARAAAAGRGLAEGLRAWIRAPRDALSPSAGLLVDLLATARRTLTHGEAAELLGADRLAGALDDAIASQLVESDATGVRFGHALVRDACHADIEPARRPGLHARLAGALARHARHDVAEVARHLLLAGDDEGARRHLAAAAERARRIGALDEAAGFLREAATAAPDGVAGELWLSLADVEAWRGKREAHDDAFDRGVALLGGTNPAARAEAYVARGRWLRTTLCFPHEALAAYRLALDIIELDGVEVPELRALALAGCAWAEAATGDVEWAHTLIDDAERLAEIHDDRALAAELALSRATALMRAGRFGAGEELSLAAAELARSTPRSDLVRIALHSAGAAASAQGAFQRALDHADRAAREPYAGPRLQAETHAARAYALSRLGRHERAIDATRAQQALAARSGDEDEEALAAFDAGCIALAAARPKDAADRLEAALRLPTRRLPRALARLRLAEARLGLGDAAGAHEELGRVPFEPVGSADLPPTLVPRLERLQGLLAAQEGDRDVAHHRLEQAEAGWRRLDAGARADDPVAASLIDLGRPPVAGLVEPGAELGRVLAERALLLARDGRAVEARAALAEAAGLARTLSFDGYATTLRRARSALRRTSARAHA